VTQVFISISAGHHLSFVLIQHKELPVTNFADFAKNLLSVLQSDTLGKGSRPHPAIIAVSHGAEFTSDSFLAHMYLAGKAFGLLVANVIAGRIVCHFELKNDFIGVESMRCTEYLNGLYLFHLGSLVSNQTLKRVLDLKKSFL
jgi:hypothetical protein